MIVSPIKLISAFSNYQADQLYNTQVEYSPAKFVIHVSKYFHYDVSSVIVRLRSYRADQIISFLGWIFSCKVCVATFPSHHSEHLIWWRCWCNAETDTTMMIGNQKTDHLLRDCMPFGFEIFLILANSLQIKSGQCRYKSRDEGGQSPLITVTLVTELNQRVESWFDEGEWGRNPVCQIWCSSSVWFWTKQHL